MYLNYKIFLYLFIIYIIIFITKLDNLDKKCVYYLIKNINNLNVEASWKTYLESLYQSLLIPFKKKLYFERFTEGGIYSSYIYEYYPNLGIQMNDKLYWANIFNKYNINHPKIICYKKYNKLIKLHNIDFNINYVKKPINGALGYNVDLIKGKDIINYSKSNYNFLVQEKLYDCIYGKARHFRAVTLYNGELFVLYLLKSKKKNIIASNLSNGGAVVLCKNFICDELTNKQQLYLNKFIKKLQNLHKKLYKNIISIGWDVMFNCNNINDLKCYCLEGNICAGIWNPDTKNINIINSYKNIVQKFYCDNNI